MSGEDRYPYSMRLERQVYFARTCTCQPITAWPYPCKPGTNEASVPHWFHPRASLCNKHDTRNATIPTCAVARNAVRAPLVYIPMRVCLTALHGAVP